MCGLCGLWGETAHWTSAASSAAGSRARTAGDRQPLRTRALQQACIERVVRTVGVSVRDWNGTSWIVAGSHGASEIVGSVPEVWRAAESLSGRRLDPLSPTVLEAAASPAPGVPHGAR